MNLAPGSMTDAPWLRLDPRMLLIQPVQELIRFLPALIGLAIAGGASGFGPWAVIGVGVPVVLGVARYLTTAYRIGNGRIELRRGVLQRRVTSARLDRVRTVDLTASVGHRILGLATLSIGTGSVGTDEDDRLSLDGLPRSDAATLRRALLDVARAPSAAGSAQAPGSAEATEATGPPSEQARTVEVARFAPPWLLYAPFTSTGLIAAAAVVGVFAQGMEALGAFNGGGEVHVEESDFPAVTGLLIAAVLAGLLLIGGVLTLAGYVVAHGNFRLSSEPGSWHVRRGLLTTRETSLDRDRVAGVAVGEGALVRLAGGARLDAIVTGLQSTGTASSILLPPCPRGTVLHAAATVLATPAPVTGALLSHGPAATRRRHTRAGAATVPLLAGVIGAVAVGAPSWLLLLLPLLIAAAFLIARDRARSLGHAWADGHVVMRSGSLTRRRTALAGEHVIGWHLEESWFQRRRGLATVVATTAGGGGRTSVDDVPTTDAYALAERATPGLLAQFRR